MATCDTCSDTGIIETGNNDIPCDCPAGDTAQFNVAGEGTLTGAEIKRRNALPQMPTIIGDRTEYGHLFRWYERPGFWHSTSGSPVMVVPPKSSIESWFLIVPHSSNARGYFEIRGHEAEKRAFCAAAGFTRSQ